jgi:hypothetical protein
MADKIAIAAGGSRFLASFSAATAGSVAFRVPSEAMTGNYQSFGDYAEGTGKKIAMDIPGNLFMSWMGGRAGGALETKILAGGGNYFNSATRQLASNFLWTSPEGKNLFGGTPQIRRSPFNAPVYDYLQPKPEDAAEQK